MLRVSCFIILVFVLSISELVSGESSVTVTRDSKTFDLIDLVLELNNTATISADAMKDLFDLIRPVWVNDSEALPVPVDSLHKYNLNFYLDIDAEDPNNIPVVYEIVSGSFPPGITMNANTGVISGSISEAQGNDGPFQNYTAFVRAIDRTNLPTRSVLEVNIVVVNMTFPLYVTKQMIESPTSKLIIAAKGDYFDGTDTGATNEVWLSDYYNLEYRTYDANTHELSAQDNGAWSFGVGGAPGNSMACTHLYAEYVVSANTIYNQWDSYSRFRQLGIVGDVTWDAVNHGNQYYQSLYRLGNSQTTAIDVSCNGWAMGIQVVRHLFDLGTSSSRSAQYDLGSYASGICAAHMSTIVRTNNPGEVCGRGETERADPFWADTTYGTAEGRAYTTGASAVTLNRNYWNGGSGSAISRTSWSDWLTLPAGHTSTIRPMMWSLTYGNMLWFEDDATPSNSGMYLITWTDAIPPEPSTTNVITPYAGSLPMSWFQTMFSGNTHNHRFVCSEVSENNFQIPYIYHEDGSTYIDMIGIIFHDAALTHTTYRLPLREKIWSVPNEDTLSIQPLRPFGESSSDLIFQHNGNLYQITDAYLPTYAPQQA